MKTIIFDENAVEWTENHDRNAVYLKFKRAQLTDLFIYRGYMYLNQIYEAFGISWNPGLVNSLYLAKSGPIIIEFEPAVDGKILIHIS